MPRCRLCGRFHGESERCRPMGRPDSAPKNAYKVQVGKADAPGQWEDALPPVGTFTAACAIFDAIHPDRPRQILKGLGLGVWRVLDAKDIARLRGRTLN